MSAYMSQYDFGKLVQKYLAGETSPEKEKLMHEWSENRLSQSQLNLDQAEKQAIKKRIWKRIHTNTLRRQPFLAQYEYGRFA